MLADGTADDYIWPMLLEKQSVLSEAGLCKDSFSDVNICEQNPDKKSSNQQQTLDSWFKSDDFLETCTQMSTTLLQDENDDLFLGIDV